MLSIDLAPLVGRRLNLPGHFSGEVTIEGVREISGSVLLRVRLSNGRLDEAVLDEDEASRLLDVSVAQSHMALPVDADKLRLLVESTRIRLAYAYDSQFAVSLSGIRTLPHQIDAVYRRMLPQPRLRFLLADDPGAGKTIMAGLLIKEMKLRGAIERVLILVPAPLTIQWQDEMLRFFGEEFGIIDSANDGRQLLNQWQRESMIIASLDYAKQEHVRERVLEQRWDVVIIDEAHKCSAYTKRSMGRGDAVEKTRRYQLAERLAATTEHLLLLTATPHHGDDDRFGHFVRLLDPEVFPEPHKLGESAREIRQAILRIDKNCPWALRRLKEDLTDMGGRPLFPNRTAETVTFKLNADEFRLYKAVTDYINQFLPQTVGRSKGSVALARTVFQRRLASSTRAIHESLIRRLKKLDDLIAQLEDLPFADRARRIAELQGRPIDAELDEDDLDEAAWDALLDRTTVADEIGKLKLEVSVLSDLVAQAAKVRVQGSESKLSALKTCLEGAKFNELTDGRGKLLIFTEHRDTQQHLKSNLETWGYGVCEIHGGMGLRDRKQAQDEFRTTKQICVATEAAGEGINLQFCRLMINYDIPWNPTRLEQRLGRIHRIGQERECHVFNFVASAPLDNQDIIEGRILAKLLEKLEQMRQALGDRVFDVIGDVLSLNDVNLPEMLREAAYDPNRLPEYIDQLNRIDPNKLEEYEKLTGIALARAHVDLSAFQRTNIEAEERRLMPKYIETQFERAAQTVGLKLAATPDGLWRIDHVLADLRSDRLESVRRVGKSEKSYRKVTFHKKHLEQDKHLDAVLIGPGHPLYAAVDERLLQILLSHQESLAVYVDGRAESPYRLHFFEVAICGENGKGDPVTLHAELICVREDTDCETRSQYCVVPTDSLIDLPAHPSPPASVCVSSMQPVADYLKSVIQAKRRTTTQAERQRHADICREYLHKSYVLRRNAAQERVMRLKGRLGGAEDMLAIQKAEQELADIERTHVDRLAGLDRSLIARHGPVRHVASALVLPMGDVSGTELVGILDGVDAKLRRDSETAAENVVLAYEKDRGWEPELVASLNLGFDIRSYGPVDPVTNTRDMANSVRRIEVKGRSRGQPIRLTTNEWYKASQLGDTYWLYVVWDPLENPDPVPVMIQNPAAHLDKAKREVLAARYFDVPADAIEAAARAQKTGVN
ncbi:MAG: DUF3883 domain-containing protein [Polyangiaceae bacterium]|nr:DUF3883 domain-containing protein [Polyangiaceae bacterium]